MGIYQEHILPHLINLAMRNKEATRYRRRLIPEARGRVLEIGIGSGLNLPFYGLQVTEVIGLDPSRKLLDMAKQEPGPFHFSTRFLQGSAENIPLPAKSVDTVVCTWSLCSIPDVRHALENVRQVLKPAGRFIFIEHGLAPESAIQRWQHRLTPAWQHIAGGCHLDRKIDELITTAGFEIDTLASEYADGPKLASFIYQGIASPGQK